MSLGLLARDSIVDLAAVNRDDLSSTLPSKDTIEAPTTYARANLGTSSSDRRKSVRSGNHTSQKEANPQQPPSFQFSGLLDDYYSDEYYNFDEDDDTHKPHFLLGGAHPSSNYRSGSLSTNKFLCCLFPWLHHAPKKQLHLQHSMSTDSSHHSRISPLPIQVEPMSNDYDTESKDGESTNSNVLGERLSDRERQAVLARLRLAQPESVTTSSQLQHQQNEGRNETKDGAEDLSVRNGKQRSKGLLNGIPVHDFPTHDDDPPKLKGILKTRSSSKVDEQTQQNTVRDARLSTIGEPQANLDVKAVNSTSGGTRRRSLFPSYEEKKPRSSNSVTFSPMARVVTVKSRNDMTLEEKSDVWWQKSDYEDFRKTGRIITRAMLEGGGEIWLTGGSSPPATSKKKKSDDSSESAETGDKWWHKFGHSRRGLEHVVSIEEGRQRQMNVKTAIRAVLDEQARQKMYKREDAEKLRHVALHHTMWARDLALASGASDADAVDQSFSEGRKSREFFLLKMSRNKAPAGSVKLDPKNVPLFMQPALHSRPSSARIGTQIATHHLDAHTASQIQFRRQKLQPDPTQSLPELELESQEQVHDPNPDETNKASLAQKAAGFSADREKVNMAAVLSGMGGAMLNQKNETLPIMRVAS
jgi:hypothetical protein